MKVSQGVTMSILVGGRNIQEYVHGETGHTFVEGRKKSEYEIQIQNHSGVKIEAVISVDGLCITDGKEAGQQSSGYLVEAGQTISIPGFLVNGSTAAKFTFGDLKSSYAAKSGGNTSNVGVIGLRVYNEVSKPTFLTYGMPFWNGAQLYKEVTPSWSGGLVPSNRSPIVASGAEGISATCSSVQMMNSTATTFTTAADKEFNIGTVFGDATDFSTVKTHFDRGVLAATMALYYDDKEGLKKRGIDVTRQQNRPTPNPFPADSACRPPSGWVDNRAR